MKCLLCNEEAKVIQSYNKSDLAPLWVNIFPEIDSELKLDIIHLYGCTNCSLKFFDPILAGGDKFYSELGKLDWYYNHPGKSEYDFIQKYIKEDYKILDVGSGSGVLFEKIAKRVDYTGLELSTKAVSLAKDKNINVIQEYIQNHAELNNNKYDLVCLFQVIEHLTELESFIKSIYDVMKNQSLFVIATPNNDGFYSITPNLTFNLPPHHTIHWTEKSLKFLASKYNFELVEVHFEPLQEIHQAIAVKSFISNVLRRVLFQPKLLVNNTYLFKIVDTVSNRIYHSSFFRKYFLNKIIKKIKFGQSVIIVLKKS